MIVKNSKTGETLDLDSVKHFPIKEFPHIVICENTMIVNTRTKNILNPTVRHTGYCEIYLGAKKEKKCFFVHVLVATYFIPNPENKPIVNHKDSDRKNNKISNLEWATASENGLHSFKCNPNRKRTNKIIYKIDKDTNEILEEFSSLKEAGEKVGVAYQNISGVLHGKHTLAGGFKWKFKDEKREQDKYEKDESLIWKPIPDYPDYEVSENGDVFSFKTNLLLSLQETPDGYIKTGIINSKNERKSVAVHILVASAFHPNPNNYPIVNHINGDKSDNFYTNLEWCSFKQNSHHALVTGLLTITRAVCQFTEKGEFKEKYNSISEASKETSTSYDFILDVCQGLYLTYKKMIWRYENECIKNEDGTYKIKDNRVNKKRRQVCQFEITGEYIAKHDSIAEASQSEGMPTKSIISVCKFRLKDDGAFIWRYIEDCKKINDDKYLLIDQNNLKPQEERKHEQYYNSAGNLCTTKNIYNKPVCKFDLEFKFISVYESIKDTNLSRISEVCRQKLKTSGGFIWRYVSDCVYMGNGIYKFENIAENSDEKESNMISEEIHDDFEESEEIDEELNNFKDFQYYGEKEFKE
jgi:hypothetical protein